MIFKPEMVEKILAGEKTVTRRPVSFASDEGLIPKRIPTPCRYKADHDYAVQPGRGQKSVARIRVKRVSRETMLALNDRDARREGFEDAGRFRVYWESLYGQPFDDDQLVNRIEFELIGVEA